MFSVIRVPLPGLLSISGPYGHRRADAPVVLVAVRPLEQQPLPVQPERAVRHEFVGAHA